MHRGSLILLTLVATQVASAEENGYPTARSRIGREVSVWIHLKDDEEFRIPLSQLIEHGKVLFCANWTNQEGAGRPLAKGNGKPLSDPRNPLVGLRSFNRVSAPDANSCVGCHNAPLGIPGGGGDFVTNVFVLGQRFDFVTFNPNDKVATKGAVDERASLASLQNVGNSRATTGMFGAGYLEMLARQMTEELHTIRDGLKLGQSARLVAKGINFGEIRWREDGLWDTSKVEGLPRMSILSNGSHDPPSLVIRPWHQAGNVVSLREFSNNAFHQHHGIQSTERFGVNTDPDGDGFMNEMTRADITAVAVFQAAMAVPGRVIPNDPAVEKAIHTGEKVFARIGCARCHVPELPLTQEAWIYTEPNPFNPPTNLRTGHTETLRVDLSSDLLPAPRLKPQNGVVMVPAYTDFKLHDICEPTDPEEPLDMNETTWSEKFHRGNKKFLTKRLWGAANEPPYFHHGLFTTLREAVLAHGGEAKESRVAFQNLEEYEQDSLIEFLKSLQVLPPGTQHLVVDEKYQKKSWPTVAAAGN